MGLTKIDDRGLKTPIELLDDEEIRLGNSDDLKIFHASSTNHSFIRQGSAVNVLFLEANNLRCRSASSPAEMLISASKDGNVELYHNGTKKLETQVYGINVSGDVFIPDNSRFVSGNSNDIQLYHSGSDSFLLHIGTGDLKLQTNSGSIELNSANENMIKAVPNGAVELYHDNTKKLETSSGGVVIQGQLDVNGNATVDDNYKFVAGSNSDLQIYHNGSQNYINTSNGSIELRHTVGGANEPMLKAYPNGQVQLMYDSSTKFETTSIGANLTGSLLVNTNTTSGISSSGDDIVIGSIGDSTSRGITFATTSDGTIRWADAGDNAMGRIQYLNNTDVMSFHTSNTKRISIDSDGLKFGSDTAAANALDDYEEGTWTPSINGLSIGNEHANTGRYVKVGNMVTVVCYINIGTHTYDGGSSTTPLQINGLPFAAGGQGTGWYGAAIGNIQRLDGGNTTQSTNRQFSMNIGPGYQALYGRWIQFGNNAFANSTLGDLYDNFAIHVSCTYRTT